MTLLNLPVFYCLYIHAYTYTQRMYFLLYGDSACNGFGGYKWRDLLFKASSSCMLGKQAPYHQATSSHAKRVFFLFFWLYDGTKATAMFQKPHLKLFWTWIFPQASDVQSASLLWCWGQVTAPSHMSRRGNNQYSCTAEPCVAKEGCSQVRFLHTFFSVYWYLGLVLGVCGCKPTYKLKGIYVI